MTRARVLGAVALVLLGGGALLAQQVAPDIRARRAALEQRLAGIQGHEPTKASIRYPFDLVRVVALGRRPFPGPEDHFDLADEFARSESLLRALEAGRDPLWRSTGDHVRHHEFAAAGEILPYRLYVPTTWDGRSALPLVLLLHGGGATENTNMDNDGGTLPRLAERRGYIVVCPLGYRPTGGFGGTGATGRAPAGLAAGMRRQRESELSERETMEVLELVMAEYGVDPHRVYLAGHSMGSGGAWHLAATYPDRWAALAPLSGPFLDTRTYPFDRLRGLPILMADGTGSAQTLPASRALQQDLRQRWLSIDYVEVDASHVGMVPLVLPRMFDFFDEHRRP